jgi:hypothetical protein
MRKCEVQEKILQYMYLFRVSKFLWIIFPAFWRYMCWGFSIKKIPSNLRGLDTNRHSKNARKEMKNKFVSSVSWYAAIKWNSKGLESLKYEENRIYWI